MERFCLHPQARRWLSVPSDDEATGDEPEAAWDEWVLRQMASGSIMELGGTLVDRALLSQRFLCVPLRCAPQANRGRHRSCCADLDVAVTNAERNRLQRHSHRLRRWLLPREPRLSDAMRASCKPGHPFWLSQDGAHLSRPGGRCVFSEANELEGIRCHLHRYAREHHEERRWVQPLPCRLFPLVLVELSFGGVLLTSVNRGTQRLVGSYPASRFPCLAEPGHPLAIETLADDLDWLFGQGFAAALRERLT